MSWLSWLVGKDKDGIIKQVADGVGQFVHTGEEKAANKAKWEEEVTKRWVADSQAPITRLIRPVAYLFVTVIVFVFGALDSSLEGFKISDAWLTTFTQIYITMTVAYFGGRSFEKIKGK
jgi:hypothetical protein